MGVSIANGAVTALPVVEDLEGLEDRCGRVPGALSQIATLSA
jgi:hypothetical protein